MLHVFFFLFVFFHSQHCRFPLTALVHVSTSKYCSPLLFRFWSTLSSNITRQKLDNTAVVHPAQVFLSLYSVVCRELILQLFRVCLCQLDLSQTCLWEGTNVLIILFSSGGCEETVDPHNERFPRRHVIIWGFGLSCCASAEEKKTTGSCPVDLIMYSIVVSVCWPTGMLYLHNAWPLHYIYHFYS